MLTLPEVAVTFRVKDQTATITLSDAQAWQLAQFLKRLRLDQCRELAEDDNTAYRMIEATEELRAGLSKVGYGPR